TADNGRLQGHVLLHGVQLTLCARGKSSGILSSIAAAAGRAAPNPLIHASRSPMPTAPLRQARQRLIEEREPRHYRFAAAGLLGSPTAAAAVALARHASGPQEWRLLGEPQL